MGYRTQQFRRVSAICFVGLAEVHRELANHKNVAANTGMDVYFADARSS
ncbi:hypothetical protein ACFRCI_18525 [Streptomyces sp. NPDC056638]